MGNFFKIVCFLVLAQNIELVSSQEDIVRINFLHDKKLAFVSMLRTEVDELKRVLSGGDLEQAAAADDAQVKLDFLHNKKRVSEDKIVHLERSIYAKKIALCQSCNIISDVDRIALLHGDHLLRVGFDPKENSLFSPEVYTGYRLVIHGKEQKNSLLACVQMNPSSHQASVAAERVRHLQQMLHYWKYYFNQQLKKDIIAFEKDHQQSLHSSILDDMKEREIEASKKIYWQVLMNDIEAESKITG